MPEMNGYEVCRQLKTDEELEHIPVIFLSALSETEDKLKAFEAGGVDYITKPFQYEEVRARVETHLRIRRRKSIPSRSKGALLYGSSEERPLSPLASRFRTRDQRFRPRRQIRPSLPGR